MNLVFGGVFAVVVGLFVVFSTATFAAPAPIGILTISGIGLNAEVVAAPPEGRILPTPERQVGLYQPYRTLTFLYGHSTTVFENLGKLKEGEIVSFENLETGQIFQYRVNAIRTHAVSEVKMGEVLAEPKLPMLIMMTCAGNYDEVTETYDARLTIWAEKI